uniref:Uncharacterized protein n=1 Tax=Setaria digitata TaxID=48799 RepID=A0A915PXP7_9BILA
MLIVIPKDCHLKSGQQWAAAAPHPREFSKTVKTKHVTYVPRWSLCNSIPPLQQVDPPLGSAGAQAPPRRSYKQSRSESEDSTHNSSCFTTFKEGYTGT